MGNEKRLAMLEKMVESGQADSFARYALALEYKSLGRLDDSLAAFTALRQADPDYVPMYLICGTMLTGAGRNAEGREWLEAGTGKAQAKGDTHALSELMDALGALVPPASID